MNLFQLVKPFFEMLDDYFITVIKWDDFYTVVLEAIEQPYDFLGNGVILEIYSYLHGFAFLKVQLDYNLKFSMGQITWVDFQLFSGTEVPAPDMVVFATRADT